MGIYKLFVKSIKSVPTEVEVSARFAIKSTVEF